MVEPLRLTVVSTSRSDFGMLAPVAIGASMDVRFACRMIVCGQHLVAGTPADDELMGLEAIRLPLPRDSISFVHQPALLDVLRTHRTEVVLIMGDRYELLDVVLVATVAGCAIAHSCGGERTNGALDNEVRDAVTKLAHLHYPAHVQAAHRLRLLQEDAWRICVSGEPGLDSLMVEERLGLEALRHIVSVVPGSGDIVVVVHPVTKRPAETVALIEAVTLLAAEWRGRVFLSSSNGDPGSEAITAAWRQLASRHAHCILLPSLGSLAFRSLVARCGALVGNSSAGLIEAPSLETPSVDAGTRQEGRLRGASVISCSDVTTAALSAAVNMALALRRSGMPNPADNPYGDGRAVPRILEHLWVHGRREDLHAK